MTLFFIFSIFVLIQLFFYLAVFSRFAFRSQHQNTNSVTAAAATCSERGLVSVAEPSRTTPPPPVSVVICARNEEESLKENLPSILSQQYPHFEVVVVNDRSGDGSALLLQSLKEKIPSLRVLEIPDSENSPGWNKKNALSLGIHSSSHDIILLTDADCSPKSAFWIQAMVSQIKNGTGIALGYGGYEKKNGFLNKIIRFDSFFIALHYFSFAFARFPYMGVGRNLAYRKKLFNRSGGFSVHSHIASGDDDLFVNRVANSRNTCCEFSSASHIISEPVNSFSSWVEQKMRHLSTGVHYRIEHKMLLFAFFISAMGFWIVFPFVLLQNHFQEIAWVLFVTKAVVQLLVFGTSMKKLEEGDLLLFSPVLEALTVFFIPFIYIAKSICLTSTRAK